MPHLASYQLHLKLQHRRQLLFGDVGLAHLLVECAQRNGDNVYQAVNDLRRHKTVRFCTRRRGGVGRNTTNNQQPGSFHLRKLERSHSATARYRGEGG